MKSQEGHVTIEAEIGMMLLQAKECRVAGNHQKLERATEGFPCSFQKTDGTAHTLISASRPYNCETINFCSFKPLSSWYFAMAAQGHKYYY